MIEGTIKEIRTAAERFIERYGDDAAAQARRRAQELSDAGHADSAAEWQRIAEIAEALLAAPESKPARLH